MATVQEFAAKIKAKYPQYQGVDDSTLAAKIVEKYPQYKSQVQFDAPKAEVPRRSAMDLLGSLNRAAFPNTANAPGFTEAPLQRVGALATDALSLPKRAFDASYAASMAGASGASGPEQVDAALEALGQRRARGILDQIGRQAPLMLTPAGAGSLVTQGVRTSIPFAIANQADRAAQGQELSSGQALGELLLGAGVGGTIQGAKRAVPAVKDAVSKYTEVAREALEDAVQPGRLGEIREAMRSTAGDMTSTARNLLEMLGGKRAAANEAAAATEAAAQRGFERQVLGARPGGALQSPEQLSAARAGQRMEEAVTGARKGAGKAFQEGQDAALKETGVAESRLRWQPAKGKKGVQNELQTEVDRFLKRIKYDPAKGYGTSGNRVIPPEAIREVLAAKEQFGTARTVKDVLDQRRLLDQKINFGGPEGKSLFAKGSDADWALGQLRDDLNDIIASSLRRRVGKQAEDAWRATNEAYSRSLRLLESVDEGARMGRNNAEAYFGKIKDIGVEGLREIKSATAQNEALRPVWSELQSGFVDNVLMRGFKDGRLDRKALASAWNGLDNDLKSILVPPETAKRINAALGKTVLEFKPSTLGKEVVGSTPDIGTATKTLENVGTKNERQALQELQILDDIFGLKGDKRFSKIAMDVFRGKQLRLTPEGNVPVMSDIRTGKGLMGISSGIATAGAGGAAAGGPIGAVIGATLGPFLGAYSQSPAGALMAYRIMNRAMNPGTGARLGSLVLGRSTRAGVGALDDGGNR